MKKQDLSYAFDLLEPSQETKYNVKNTINAKNEGRKPFLKRFKRPALAVTCFVVASVLVITAAAAGSAQLFSLIYGSDVSAFEPYISEGSAPVSTENVSFTLEGVIYDGYQGQALVSLYALTDAGKAMIEQFNADVSDFSRELRTGQVFWDEGPDYLRVICNNRMVIYGGTDMRSLAFRFNVYPLTGPLGDEKSYYRVSWSSGGKEAPVMQIGWTDNAVNALTDFDVSLITNTIQIDCAGTEPGEPEYFNPAEIVVSPMAVHVRTKNPANYMKKLGNSAEMFDDKILIKLSDGKTYDLFDYCARGYQPYPANGNFMSREQRGYGETGENGEQYYCYIFSYTFGELIDINKVESVIFFGAEYKLR